MVEPHALARAEDLSLQINLLHINYLQADESPEKIEQRTKLESKFAIFPLTVLAFMHVKAEVNTSLSYFSFSDYIRKYLCMIAHGRKFIFSKTAEVLRRSVDSRENFSAYRASTAFNAIARYAANLIAQPWRKEFRTIKVRGDEKHLSSLGGSYQELCTADSLMVKIVMLHGKH